MTTVDDFHRLLDRRWNDHQTRLILADFLDEHGTTEEDRLRARGYRELGLRRIRPFVMMSDYREFPTAYVTGRQRRWRFLNSGCPEQWEKEEKEVCLYLRSAVIPSDLIEPGGFDYNNFTRRELEDDWALRIGRHLQAQETVKV